MAQIPGDTVVIATKNTGKKAELEAVLREVLGDFAVRTAGELGLADVTEDGVTFEENALLKARAAARESGLPAIADDSGLIVDVLGQAPGILSARWAGRHGDDRANLELLLAQLSDIPDHARGARFVCAAAYASPDGAEVVCRGEMVGTIVREPCGAGGFGYDPIFLPAGEDETAAQMSPERKNSMSHRGIALRALAQALR